MIKIPLSENANPECQHGFTGPCSKCVEDGPPSLGTYAAFRAAAAALRSISAETMAETMSELHKRAGMPLDAISDLMTEPDEVVEQVYRKLKDSTICGINGITDAAPDLTLRANLDRALSKYARQFHIPCAEGEDSIEWLGKIEPFMRGRSNSVTFFAFLKSVVAAAKGISDDELDALITPNRNTPQTPPVHSSPSNPPTLAYDPATRTIVGSSLAKPKDSLLNPAPKGFIGSGNLPYDSDVD